MDFIRPRSLIVLFLVFVCASSELDLLLYKSGHMLTNSSGSFFINCFSPAPMFFYKLDVLLQGGDKSKLYF